MAVNGKTESRIGSCCCTLNFKRFTSSMEQTARPASAGPRARLVVAVIGPAGDSGISRHGRVAHRQTFKPRNVVDVAGPLFFAAVLCWAKVYGQLALLVGSSPSQSGWR